MCVCGHLGCVPPCGPMDCSPLMGLFCPWDSLGKTIGVGCCALFEGK